MQGKPVINGGWRWGWVFSGSCGPLLKETPGQVGKVDTTTDLDFIFNTMSGFDEEHEIFGRD